ncbi:hypothetical protein [Mesorhizobium sp.]|nr:hypothetical protein [Mesorhizobium sp.]
MELTRRLTPKPKLGAGTILATVTTATLLILFGKQRFYRAAKELME